MTTDSQPSGPDLRAGIDPDRIPEGGCLGGRVDGEAVLLVRTGGEWLAIGSTCSHYGGPLAEGLIVGDTVRCPWHHACFSLRTGAALRPPALKDLDRYSVEQRGGKVFVTGKAPAVARAKPRAATAPESVVIVGGGAAGDSAAATLRREGYVGPITIVDHDRDAPYDRPNCSKDYLAGNAPEDWLPLRSGDYDREQEITRLAGRKVTDLTPKRQEISLDDGRTLRYGALLLATGASPIRLGPETVGPDAAVYYLRTLADSRAIIAAAGKARQAVVLGASFIGLEVAASLRARGLEVHLVAPEARPLERVLGAELGDFVRRLHEEHGVVFHLERKARTIGMDGVVLETGEKLAADLVVAGIGVRPNLGLAERAGLAVDRGLSVNEMLETSAPGIFAAGDICRWPDPHSGEKIRVEHWVVAQRQGQAAARNMLGHGRRFDAVPFFWSQHYDVPINYVGYADRVDATEIEGDIAGRDAVVRFLRGGKTLAVASIYRDRESLESEVGMERASRST
jgi:NADPH-dependent 2,4-dienoyl-CoA reductase/sulfur reductase-like enzyme/nitrite reductase/ring-hydroxylating ferredoxin subunit